MALGFAIPAATAVQVAEQLLKDGKADHSFIGLSPADITSQIAEQLHLPDTEGVLVLSVVRNGPADRAGLRPEDVLLSLEGPKLNAPEDLLAALRSKAPGQAVSVQYRRGADVGDTKVTLSERPTAEG